MNNRSIHELYIKSIFHIFIAEIDVRTVYVQVLYIWGIWWGILSWIWHSTGRNWNGEYNFEWWCRQRGMQTEGSIEKKGSSCTYVCVCELVWLPQLEEELVGKRSGVDNIILLYTFVLLCFDENATSSLLSIIVWPYNKFCIHFSVYQLKIKYCCVNLIGMSFIWIALHLQKKKNKKFRGGEGAFSLR